MGFVRLSSGLDTLALFYPGHRQSMMHASRTRWIQRYYQIPTPPTSAMAPATPHTLYINLSSRVVHPAHTLPVAPALAALFDPYFKGLPLTTSADAILTPSHDLVAAIDHRSDIIPFLVFVVEPFERDMTEERREVRGAPLSIVYSVV